MIKKFSWVYVVLVMGSTAWGQRAQEVAAQEHEQTIVEYWDQMLYVQLSGSSNTPESVVQHALQHSPEIRKAELAVESAQADLALVRARITRDVIALHAKVTSLRNHKKRVEKRVDNGTSPTFDLEQVLVSLAEVEAEFKYLTGSRDSVDRKSALDNLHVGVVAEKPVAVQRPAIAKGTSLWDILQQPVGITFENITWRDMMEVLSDNYELNVNVDATLMEVLVRRINLKNVSRAIKVEVQH